MHIRNTPRLVIEVFKFYKGLSPVISGVIFTGNYWRTTSLGRNQLSNWYLHTSAIKSVNKNQYLKPIQEKKIKKRKSKQK